MVSPIVHRVGPTLALRRGMLPQGPAHSLSVDALEASLCVNRKTGHRPADVIRLSLRHGPNAIREVKRPSLAKILFRQFKGTIVWLLLGAMVLSFAWGEIAEGVAVGAVLVINALLGFVTELRAIRSMEALRELGNPEAVVRRDGTQISIPARDVVPGDVLLVEGGVRVAADARLFLASKLAADESTLTGESLPVEKSTSVVPEEARLGDRTSMIFQGTGITRGSGEAIVVATGDATELGQIAHLVRESGTLDTPLEKRLSRLGRQLVWLSLAFVAFIAAAGLLAGQTLTLVVGAALALLIATVPEGLPIVATMALARGVWRMARRQALISDLSAVETLGSTGVILTDKTGTLTENRMTVTSIVVDGGVVNLGAEDFTAEDAALITEAMTVAALCNDASLSPQGAQRDSEEGHLGDPMEVALLLAAAKAALRRGDLLATMPEVRQEAFDPRLRLMATVHNARDGFLFAVKGSTEAVLAGSSWLSTPAGPRELKAEDREAWLLTSEAEASEGRRVLALAQKVSPDLHATAYDGLCFLGLAVFHDPPRPEVRAALGLCRSAGVRTVMVTGDHAATAASVARSVGLVDGAPNVILGEMLDSPSMSAEDRTRVLTADVVARATPKEKLALLKEYQAAGHVVAMLGDGVNDAPALVHADIGVAMGQRGTQVARDAADMVLLDDRLQSVVAAIEQGRIIFDNIRTFVVYLLSCNLAEILVVGLATASGAPLPLLPLQILYLNLVTDVFPALAFTASEGSPGVMARAPRPRAAPVLRREDWGRILAYGGLLTACVLSAFALALGLLEFEPERAVTVAFLSLGFCQLAHVFNLSAPDSGLVVNEVTTNRTMWGALLLSSALLVLAAYAPGLRDLLHTKPIGADGWLLVAGASFLPVVLTLATRRTIRVFRRWPPRPTVVWPVSDGPPEVRPASPADF